MTTHHPQPRVSRLYRNGTIVFLACAIVMAGAIAFISFSSTTITVTVAGHDVTASAAIAVAAAPNADTGTIAGTILTVTKQGTATNDVPKSGATVDDYAHGTVSFTNNWAKTQPLAAGTRLKATSNSLIYRTAARVDVPVGGHVTATVVCDTKGTAGEIGPDHFEIVALWPGLKTQIFADSTESMTGGTRSSAQLAQATIDEATAALLKQLSDEATAAKPTAPDGMTLIDAPFTLSSSITSSAKAGDQVSTFTVQGSASLAFVAVNKDGLNTSLAAALKTALSANERYLDTAPEATWKLIDLSAKNGTAHLQATLKARATLTADSALLAPSHFVNFTPEDIRSSLLGTPGVTAVHVALAPFWASHTPSNASQIHVTVIR